MAQWYSKADRERMAQGLPPLPHSTLTEEDYKDLVAFALAEAVEQSPAKEQVGSATVGDLEGKHAAVTRNETDAEGKLTGKYAITVDWGSKMRQQAADVRNGPAYVAQRLTSAFHEVRHVEQKAMLSGDMPMESKSDAEVVTQMTVNDLYPTVFKRGYSNTITEVDADVSGLKGALAFADAHPELKERYGFDFRKQIMRTDEYDLLEDSYQVTKATPEELLEKMAAYRDKVYGDLWLDKDAWRVTGDTKLGTSETTFMQHLEGAHGVTWDDLAKMDNDDRNVLLIENAMEVMDDPSARIASSLRAYREGIVMANRLDKAVQGQPTLQDVYQGITNGIPDPAQWYPSFNSAGTLQAPAAAPMKTGKAIADRGQMAVALLDRLSLPVKCDPGLEL